MCIRDHSSFVKIHPREFLVTMAPRSDTSYLQALDVCVSSLRCIHMGLEIIHRALPILRSPVWPILTDLDDQETNAPNLKALRESYRAVSQWVLTSIVR